MKNKILSLMVSLVGALMFPACDNPNYGTEVESHGFLSFDNFGVTVEEPKSDVESRAIQTVDVSNYLVSITNKSTNRRALYKKYGELPGVVDLPVGSYTVKVESHDVAPAEFDRPYYMGSQDINIEEDKVCDAGTIVCKFSSIRVSVEFSEKLTPLLGEDVVVTVSGANGAQLEFKRNDTRSGYFKAVAGMTTLLARITGTINGKPLTEDLTMPIQNVQAGKHYVIRFKVKGLPDAPDETGTIDPGQGVTLDTSIVYSDENNIGGNVNVDEDIIGDANRPGQEDPETPDNPDTPDDPNDTAITFDKPDGCMLDIVGGVNEIDSYVGDAIVIIKSETGFKKLDVVIDSEGLTPEVLSGVGLSSEFDLVTGLDPNGKDLSEGLAGLGLPIKDQITSAQDNTVYFDISQFVPLLGIYPGKSNFTITVTPITGAPKSMTLKFQK